MLARLLRHHGVDVTVLSLTEQRTESVGPALQQAGVRVVCMPPSSAHGLLDARRFLRVLSFVRRDRFDLVHSHLFYANSIGCLAARLCGTPAIATLHDTGQDPRGLTRVKERIEGLLLRRAASAVAAVGEAVARAHVAKARPGRMVVLPNPVSGTVHLTEEQRRVLREQLTGDPARPLLVSASRLSAQKGHADLVHAFAAVRRNHPTAVLVLAGHGPLHADLQRLVTELGLDASVSLVGWRDDVPQLLAAADAYLSASLWEGSPLVILEAMGAGLPVVATAVGDVPSLLSDGRGLLVAAGDVAGLARAMSTVLTDAEMAARMAAAARRYVFDVHDAERWRKKVTALYAAVQPSVAWDRGPSPEKARPGPCAG
ncbi:MAG: glycosyltransferase [Chloroflexota bacterium]|nr:glycosyltransferase [Chloroflexota bacterium]